MPEIRHKDGAAQQNGLDIAVVNPRKQGKETRYDVVSIDLTGKYPAIKTRLGKKFALVEALPRENTLVGRWYQAVEQDPCSFMEIHFVEEEPFIKWAVGKSSTSSEGVSYASLKDFVESREEEPTFGDNGEDEDYDDHDEPHARWDNIREVSRISPALAGALPFLPMQAVELD